MAQILSSYRAVATALAEQPVTQITRLFPKIDAIAPQDTPEIGTATEVTRAIALHTVSSV